MQTLLCITYLHSLLIFSADTLDVAVAIQVTLEMEIQFVKNGP